MGGIGAPMFGMLLGTVRGGGGGGGGGGGWKLFRGPPKAEDVHQGALGDCWFLSALSVIAEYEGGRLIHRLFPGEQKGAREG